MRCAVATCWLFAVSSFFFCVFRAAPGAVAADNLAAGRAVRFAPAPNYRLTMKGDTDSQDLTDGRLSERPDKHMWFESHCVGFSYPGLQNLVVDLGEARSVGEVAMRFQGGSPQPGICVPVWIDVVGSLDGEAYYRLGSYSRWRRGDRTRFGVPANDGTAWIHTFRFAAVNRRARFIGISFYGTGLCVSDELWVHAGEPGVPGLAGLPAAPFGVTSPAMYFHKPVVQVSTNVLTPNPVGLLVPPGWEAAALTAELECPRGVSLVGGRIGGVSAADMASERMGADGGGGTRYRFETAPGASTKAWGRVYLSCDWAEGTEGDLRFRLSNGGQTARWGTQRLRAVTIPRTPQPQALAVGLGWWSMSSTRGWPDGISAMTHLGLNVLPLFARWMDAEDREAELAVLDDWRAKGLRVMNIDSPFHHMLSKHKDAGELYAQFEDGTTGTRFCPSYRGRLYREEVARVAAQTAETGAAFLSCDIELWNWRGPLDCETCMRCRKDFEESGLDDWGEWRLRKGREIWTDLSAAVRAATRQAAEDDPSKPKTVEIGGYDFRPGEAYQHFWPFDRLYPEHTDNAQVSTYTPLEPYHIALIGDRVRADRLKLGRSDILPWLTPGDAGTFPGQAFRYALLECFANGARGVHFWSSRVWDTESLAAYAEAIRCAGQVEDIIVEGAPAEGLEALPADAAEGAGEDAQPENAPRVTGMALDGRFFVVVADYRLDEGTRTVAVRVPVQVASEAVDLLSGRSLGRLSPAEPVFRVVLGAERAAALSVRPVP